MKPTIKRTLIAFGYSLAVASSLSAALRTWDGGGLDGVFRNPFNWDTNLSFPTPSVDILQVGENTIGGSPIIGFETGNEFRTPSFTFLASAVTPYSVRALSLPDDVLTLTGTGVVLVNSSPVRQEFFSIATRVGAATQTWNGGAQGLIMAQVDLGDDRVLTFDGTGTSATTRNEIRGKITGTLGFTAGLTKTGTGTLLLDNSDDVNPNAYTGPTIVQNGKLQLGRANQIPDTSKLVLNGGTFDTGGFSDTMGALVLGGSATIDFGTTNTVSLVFGDSHLELWSVGTLNITNFTVGADTLRFGTDASALTVGQLAQISFNGMPASISSTGFVQPIPEPGVPAIILSGLGVFGFYRRHRRGRVAA